MITITADNRKPGMGDAERAALHKTMAAASGKVRVEGKDFIISVDVPGTNPERDRTEASLSGSKARSSSSTAPGPIQYCRARRALDGSRLSGTSHRLGQRSNRRLKGPLLAHIPVRGAAQVSHLSGDVPCGRHRPTGKSILTGHLEQRFLSSNRPTFSSVRRSISWHEDD